MHLTNSGLRLPTETEWEYAARSGSHWSDYFLFSGSDNIDEVAWYKQNSNGQIHPVGLRSPNQLGFYDTCGNIWEWCRDWFIRDTNLIPNDGSPYVMETNDRVLRGGCNYNGAIHCTVSKRYEISPDSEDGAIGLRVAMTIT